jgi:HSP20 family protein
MEQSRSLLPSLPKQLRQRFLSPLRAFSQMEEDMQRWFDEASLLPTGFYDGVDFIPQCDLKETNKEYVARFDIPGVKKNQLKIEVDGNRLTVRGERKSEKEEKDERRYFAESTYGSFMRSFTLPSKIEEAKVDAHFDAGVLTVKIPKTEASKAKEIEIH